ncbi:hypothetical protein BGX38DRAFT_1213699 [Terfezia claveryi]|nr:hypothetical protein BGX38DRAFT_1213699 [Terfezia claveryi]
MTPPAAQDPGVKKKEALIVGIDFGTTYSGVAWAFTGDKKVRTIRKWPGEVLQMDKVKTELAYKNDGVKYKWGFDVKKDVTNSLRWFKLLLHNTDDGNRSLYSQDHEDNISREKFRRLKQTIDAMPDGKTPCDLTRDYLKALHNHLMVTLGKQFLPSFIKTLGKEVPVYYYLTVPAMWSTKAKELTLKGAKAAGIGELGPIRLVSEPEAAAAHCFTQYQGTQHSLKVNDVYVIADCGGGTVDMISYEITSVAPTLKVKEAAVGVGGLYGSVYLNDSFEKLVKERIGEVQFNKMTQQGKEEMTSYFDTCLKKTFSISRNEDDDDYDDEDGLDEFPCPVPGVPDNHDAGVITESLMLTREDVQSIFDPIFEKITAMVQEQVAEAESNIQRPVTGIILVGGFGSSEYLHQHLENNVKGGYQQQLAVLQAPEAWQAIVQGAVQHGLSVHESLSQSALDGEGDIRSGIVQSRRVRESYGISAMEEYSAELHAQCKHKVFFSMMHGTMMCPARMQWFITKGQELRDDKPHKVRNLQRMFPVGASKKELVVTKEVFKSSADRAPEDEEHLSTYLANSEIFTKVP